jgi:hypothetical protein
MWHVALCMHLSWRCILERRDAAYRVLVGNLRGRQSLCSHCTDWSIIKCTLQSTLYVTIPFCNELTVQTQTYHCILFSVLATTATHIQNSDPSVHKSKMCVYSWLYRLIFWLSDTSNTKFGEFKFTHTCNLKYYLLISGLGSWVGIVTDYGLGSPGIESRWGQDFPHLSRPALGPAQPPVQWVPGVKYSWGMLLTTTHPLLVPWSWKSRAIPLPTLWPTLGL